MNVDSESGFLWKLLWKIVTLPITLLMVLFGKKEFKDIFEPIRYILEVLFQAKFTITLILLNIIMFIVMPFFNENIINMLINNSTDLFSARAYTIITSGFLHANLGHLLGNMLALLIFGRVVERELDVGKTFLIYFGALILSGVFSSLIYMFILNKTVASVGASGAIMGLISTAALLRPWYITFEALIPLPIMVISWLTIFLDITGVLNPTADGIGHFAHLGGYISIGILVFLLERDKREQIRKGFITNIVSIIVIAIIAKLLKIF
ncbi:MAG: rhomboid family intramembrane serine protease [Candidatus Woesearchaeota archaeon]